jgi:hypothetical protein
MEPRALVHEVKGDGESVVLIPGGLTGWVSWIPHAELGSCGHHGALPSGAGAVAGIAVLAMGAARYLYHRGQHQQVRH